MFEYQNVKRAITDLILAASYWVFSNTLLVENICFLRKYFMNKINTFFFQLIILHYALSLCKVSHITYKNIKSNKELYLVTVFDLNNVI